MQNINMLLPNVLVEKFMHLVQDCLSAMENSGWQRAIVNLLSSLICRDTCKDPVKIESLLK
jgi:hypothetical protein